MTLYYSGRNLMEIVRPFCCRSIYVLNYDNDDDDDNDDDGDDVNDDDDDDDETR